MIPSRPMGNEVRVGNQNARRVFVRLEHAHRFARLHHQCLIVFKSTKRRDDHIVVFPSARSAANAAIDNKFVGAFSNVWMQVVHQHAQWRFGQPTFCRQLCSCRGKDVSGVFARIAHFVPFKVGARSASDCRRGVRCARNREALTSSNCQGLTSARR